MLAAKKYPNEEFVGVVGIVVSFVVGLWGSRIDPFGRRKPMIGIVIPSRVPFHVEVRSGMKEVLPKEDAEYKDEAGMSESPVDDLQSFRGLLSKTMRRCPDYLILWPPGPDAASSIEVVNAVKT